MGFVDESNCMVLNKEVQFDDWLFRHLHKLLVHHGFIVESEKINKDIIPNVSEYSTSKPDCLIYHGPSFCRREISAANVHVIDEISPENVDSVWCQAKLWS